MCEYTSWLLLGQDSGPKVKLFRYTMGWGEKWAGVSNPDLSEGDAQEEPWLRHRENNAQLPYLTKHMGVGRIY